MKIELRTGKVKEVRAANMVPGVLYGKKMDATSIMIDEKTLRSSYNEFGTSMTFQVTLGTKKHTVFIKEVQMELLKADRFVHFDLQKVSETDKMINAIPVVAINREEVEKRKLFVQIVTTAIETEYKVGKGIISFDIDVAKLEAGDAIYIKDLVVSKDLHILEDPEKMVLIVKEPTVHVEEEPEEEIEETEEEDVEVEKHDKAKHDKE